MTTHRNARRATLATLLVAGGLAAGCSDGPVAPGNPPVSAPIVWSQIRGGLGVGEIRSLWGSSPENILAVHAAGILRYNGSAWHADTMPPSLPMLNAVWGPGSGGAFAVGDAGTFLRHNGTAWIEMAGATAWDIRDVHGRSASDVYAVASTGTQDGADLLRFDGMAWASVALHPGVDGNALFAVPGTVFVACDNGFMLRFDGTVLHADSTGASHDLFDVWAASSTDAYAVGEAGCILRWDGISWAPMTSGVATRLRTVSAWSSSDIVAGGDDGVLLRYDGAGWSAIPTGTPSSIATSWAFPAGQGVAGGDFGTVLFGSGASWAPRHRGQPFAFDAVWSDGNYYMAVGTGPAGGVARDRNGFGWTFPEGLHAVNGWGFGDLVAAGEDGALYRFDGYEWMSETSPTSSTLRSLTALVSRFGEPFRVYAAGDNGTLLVWKGGGWSVATPPAGAENHQFVDVWAAAIDDVFAVASNATSIARHDDPYELAGWTLEDTPASAPLLAVGGWRGDVYIASAAGEIFTNSGNGWQGVQSPVTVPIRDIRALSESSVYAVCHGGAIIHFDGVSWRTTDTGFAGDLRGIWGSEESALFAVGEDGAVLTRKD